MRTLTVLVLALAATILVTPGCRSREKEREALEEIEKSNQRVKESIREGMTEDGFRVDHEALAEQQKATQKAGEMLGGKQGEALKILAEIQGEANGYAKKLEEQSETLVAAMDWATLAEEDDYDDRREALRKYADFNREAIAFYESRPDELAKRFDGINFTGKERKEVEDGFAQGFGKVLPLIREIRECEISACEIGTRTIDLLEEEKGKWSWKSEDEFVEFENEDAAETFEKEMTQLIEVGSKQVELQQRVVNGL